MVGKESCTPRWETRAVQTEREQIIKDGASMQCYAETNESIRPKLLALHRVEETQQIVRGQGGGVGKTSMVCKN